MDLPSVCHRVMSLPGLCPVILQRCLSFFCQLPVVTGAGSPVGRRSGAVQGRSAATAAAPTHLGRRLGASPDAVFATQRASRLCGPRMPPKNGPVARPALVCSGRVSPALCRRESTGRLTGATGTTLAARDAPVTQALHRVTGVALLSPGADRGRRGRWGTGPSVAPATRGVLQLVMCLR